MIETRLLSAWDGFIGAAALVAIIALGLCVMVRVVKTGDVPRHLGMIVGIVILLVMLPALIVGLRNGMTFGQQLGTLFFLALFGWLLIGTCHTAKGRRR
jgi:hypothetical protein